MKICLNTILLVFLCFNLFGQDIWQEAIPSEIDGQKKDRVSNPVNYRSLSFNTFSFLNKVKDISERSTLGSGNEVVLAIPLPNGKSERFEIVDAELMHPILAAKFPQLKAFIGKGIDDPTATIRITYSPYFGFNGMILSGKHSTVYIDPITKDNVHYMSYYRDDVTRRGRAFTCFTDESNAEYQEQLDVRVPALGDCNLRRYRLAQSCTGEYSDYHIGQAGGTTGTTAGDKAIVQAAMNVTMNRVNGVYEKDLGTTMQFIANNDLIIYLDAANDPWTNEWNTQTAVTIDAEIGVNNYDIGHNFNDTGGGNAGCLDCVCLSNSQSGTHKGRGYTGQSTPIGDPFDIDYVAHEMGHQFGGYHTQSNNSCRSGSGATEVEPGSASTIMGYAGICTANVQNQSDDYFAYVNIRDIVTSINGGNGSGCAELIVSGNAGPSADAGADYSIPISTPFILEGVGSDPDDTGLTFCWEQNDPENPSSNATPPTTRTVGPMFRSLDPVTVPYRYMPSLTDIVNNVSPTWEVLPSVTRNMEFSFIVRDNNAISGCTASDLMSVSTVAGAGPFLVTSPNTNVMWGTTTTETVTWDVANTDAAPVSCANVDILLSIDGGFTYPITLSSAVPNDGSQTVTVPNNITTTARIRIQCSDNIFFDISDTDFEIFAANPDYTLASSTLTQDVCPPNDAVYTITTESILSYADPITFSTTGFDPALTATFAPNPATPGQTVVLTVSNTSGVANGNYNFGVDGSSTSGTKSLSFGLEILGQPSAFALTSPTNGETDVTTMPTFDWAVSTDATDYRFILSTDAAFATIIEDVPSLITNNYTTSVILSPTTTYYWKIEATNICGQSNSTEHSFTTANISCTSSPAGDTPITILTSGAVPVSSVINIATTATITDVIISNLDITHEWVGDLIVTLEHGGVTVTLIDQPGLPASQFGCDEDDILASFDDTAVGLVEGVCAAATPTIAGTFLPIDALSAFDGMDMMGDWTLTVDDQYAASDGGSFNDWNLNICATAPTSACLPNVSMTGAQNTGMVLIESSQNITSVETITGTANIDYSAGVDICLNAEFAVELGAEFHAYILGCTPLTAPTDEVQRINIIENDQIESIGLDLNIDAKESVSIRLLNQMGQISTIIISDKILEKGTHHLDINTSDINAGIYFCEIKIGTEIVVKKIVVSK